MISERATNDEVMMATDSEVTPLRHRVDDLEDITATHSGHLEQLGDEAATWRCLRTTGILGGLRWLLTGKLPDPQPQLDARIREERLLLK